MPKNVNKPLSSRLTAVQVQMEEIITARLVGGGLNAQFSSSEDMAAVAARFIKPNSKLTSFQRLEIYNQQYWYRVIDSLKEDFSALRAYLGDEIFELIVTGYLEKYKSRSYTMRNLGANLAGYIKAEQLPTKSKSKLCSQIAAFEWANVIAFDEEFIDPVSTKDIEKPGFINTKLRLQPYISVMKLDYNVDSFQAQVKELDELGESQGAKQRRIVPEKRVTYCVVHRIDNVVHHKKVDAFSFVVLNIFKNGCSLNELGEQLASSSVHYSDAQIAQQLSNHFFLWTKLDWLYIDPDQGSGVKNERL